MSKNDHFWTHFWTPLERSGSVPEILSGHTGRFRVGTEKRWKKGSKKWSKNDLFLVVSGTPEIHDFWATGGKPRILEFTEKKWSVFYIFVTSDLVFALHVLCVFWKLFVQKVFKKVEPISVEIFKTGFLNIGDGRIVRFHARKTLRVILTGKIRVGGSRRRYLGRHEKVPPKTRAANLGTFRFFSVFFIFAFLFQEVHLECTHA